MVEVATGSSGTRALRSEYPYEEGLTAGTQKQEGRKMRLEAEQGSFIRRDEKEGID